MNSTENEVAIKKADTAIAGKESNVFISYTTDKGVRVGREAFCDQLCGALVTNVEFARWRMLQFRETLAYLGEIRRWVWHLEQEPSLIGLLKVCVRSRLYWSRRHTALLVLRPSQDQLLEFNEFADLMQRVESIRSNVLDSCSSQLEKSLAECYMENMNLRKRLVEADRQSFEALFNVLIASGNMGDDVQNSDQSFAPSTQLDDRYLLAATLLCASLWIVDHKLTSWQIELRHEAGPYAISICDHSDLIRGTVKLFEMVFTAASKALQDKECSILNTHFAKAEEILANLRIIQQSLGDTWKTINKEQAINLDETQLAFDEILHPCDRLAKTCIDEICQEVIKPQKQARWLFNSMRQSMIPDQVWSLWESFSFGGNNDLPTPDDDQDALESLTERFQNSHDAGCIDSWISHLCSNRNSAMNDSCSLVCDLLDRLFDVRVELAKNRAQEFIIGPTPTNIAPKGLFQLQIVGVVTHQLGFNPKIYQQEAVWVKDLIQAVFSAKPDNFGCEQHRNAVAASLLSLYYIVCSAAWDHSKELADLTKWCLNQISSDALRAYFRQSLADDLSALMPDLENGRNAAKLFTLARFITPDSLRWKDPRILQSLEHVKSGIEEIALKAL